MADEYLEWDSGHRADGNHRWKHPNQTCGVPGSAHDIFDRAKHAATVKVDNEQTRLSHACVASGRYDPHVYYRGMIAAWETEYAEVSQALEVYAATAPNDEAAKIVPTVRRGLEHSRQSIEHLRSTYADIAATADKGWSSRGGCGSRRGGGPLGGLPTPILYAMLLACVAGIFFLTKGGH